MPQVLQRHPVLVGVVVSPEVRFISTRRAKEASTGYFGFGAHWADIDNTEALRGEVGEERDAFQRRRALLHGDQPEAIPE